MGNKFLHDGRVEANSYMYTHTCIRMYVHKATISLTVDSDVQ